MDKNNSLITLPKDFLHKDPNQGARKIAWTSLGFVVSVALLLIFQQMNLTSLSAIWMWVIGLALLITFAGIIRSLYKSHYKQMTLSTEGLILIKPLLGSQFIPWSELHVIHKKYLKFQKPYGQIDLNVEHQSIAISQARRFYYSDIYRPVIRMDFVDVEYLSFTDEQLNSVLLHIYHQGWGHEYEYLDLYENTKFFDTGHNARCIQAMAALHYLRQGLEAPRYLKLLTDVRGGLEILVTTLPASLRETIPLEVLQKTPAIYSENTLVE